MLDSPQTIQMPYFDVEHIAVQKHERVQRLRLRRRRYLTFGGKMIDESDDARRANVARMAFVRNCAAASDRWHAWVDCIAARRP